MGLPFLPFTAGYIQTRLYAVITAAGLTPWTSTDSGVPQGCTEGFFLYLLVTLPLAFELARVYPVYDGYLLRSPLIDFADGNLLTTADRHRNAANAGLPTTTDQSSAILQLTTTYLDAHHLLVHPRKSVGLADVGIPAPDILGSEPLHLEDTTVTCGSHRSPSITTSRSQTSWKGAWPIHLDLPGGTACLRRAWHTSWRRCSTRPSDTRPYTSRTPRAPCDTPANK